MICACGYEKECHIWCGYGHENGLCPPNTPENIAAVQKEVNRPRCDFCNEAAPYGDARNHWSALHLSQTHRLFYKLKKWLAKT